MADIETYTGGESPKAAKIAEGFKAGQKVKVTVEATVVAGNAETLHVVFDAPINGLDVPVSAVTPTVQDTPPQA